MLHALLALLCVVVLALVVVVTVLWRRARRRVADVEQRLSLVERRADIAEGHRLAGLLRFGAIEATLRPCPRVHLDRLPNSWTRTSARRPPDEEELNPLLPIRRAPVDAPPSTLRSRK